MGGQVHTPDTIAGTCACETTGTLIAGFTPYHVHALVHHGDAS